MIIKLNKKIFFLLLIIPEMFIFRCAEDTVLEDLTPPRAPVLQPKSADTAAVESGIDAVPEGDWIYLEWEPNPEEDLAGYFVYRSTDSLFGFDTTGIVQVDQPFSDSSFVDKDPGVAPPENSSGDTLYYFVTAYDRSDNESQPSDTVHYQLVQKADNLSENGDLRTPTLKWHYPPTNYYPEAFLVKLYHDDTGDLLWLYRHPTPYGSEFEVDYNSDGTATLDSLMVSVKYRWRVDAVMIDSTAGSESHEKDFIVTE